MLLKESKGWVRASTFSSGNFPEGYLEAEKVFCKEVNDAFTRKVNEEGNLAAVREKVRLKRLEFYKKWLVEQS